MISNVEMLRKITEKAESDGRYRKEAFFFILAALEYTVSKLPARRHLTGQEFSRGIAGYAREQYGFLARTVLNHWGITGTMDFGEIVYLLIEIRLMSKTEEDKKEDFFRVYDFDEEFDWPDSGLFGEPDDPGDSDPEDTDDPSEEM
ncbi:hypothetical protein LLG96_16480 [bacterium]|nr:hypothetical protein [bacterium]